jgi:hypothetical protein
MLQEVPAEFGPPVINLRRAASHAFAHSTRTRNAIVTY